jgi:hypothetical protein
MWSLMTLCSITSHTNSVSDTFCMLKITKTKLRFEVAWSHLSCSSWQNCIWPDGTHKYRVLVCHFPEGTKEITQISATDSNPLSPKHEARLLLLTIIPGKADPFLSASWGQLRSYLEEIVAAPVKKTETNGRGDPLRWPRNTLYPQKSTLLRQQAAVARSA